MFKVEWLSILNRAYMPNTWSKYIHMSVSVNCISTKLMLLIVHINNDLNLSTYCYFQAYQVDNPLKRTTRARILVTVEDVNDHIPEMEHAQYTFGIQENLPTGMMVANLSASDQDLVRYQQTGKRKPNWDSFPSDCWRNFNNP